MSERVLTARELNRALLARQLLLERSALSIPCALEQVGGLQAQYAPSAYVALWSRLGGFRRDALTKALEQRRAVQATLMRATIHIVSARDYPYFAAAIRKSRKDWWLRVQGKQLKGIDMAAVAARVRRLLTDGPRRQSEIQNRLEAEGFRLEPFARLSATARRALEEEAERLAAFHADYGQMSTGVGICLDEPSQASQSKAGGSDEDLAGFTAGGGTTGGHHRARHRTGVRNKDHARCPGDRDREPAAGRGEW